jgi:hypothetical protein
VISEEFKGIRSFDMIVGEIMRRVEDDLISGSVNPGIVLMKPGDPQDHWISP